MKGKHLSATIAILAITAVPSSAALSMLDSSAFANKYNGNEIFDGATTINSWAPTAAPNDPGLALNGSNLTFDLTGTNGWVQQDDGSTPWESGSGSWTVEVRAMVSANAGAGGFVIWGALNGERDIMTIRESSVTDLGGTVFDSSNNVGAFHDFRIAYDSLEDVYHYFRDGVQITPAAGIGQQAGTGNTRLIVGDCCTNIAGSTFGGPGTSVEFEYVRYDNTGAFSPIPEPSIAALFGLAGILFLRRRR